MRTQTQYTPHICIQEKLLQPGSKIYWMTGNFDQLIRHTWNAFVQKATVLILRCVFSATPQHHRSLSGNSEPSSALSPALVSIPQTSSSGSCWPLPASSTPQPPLTKPGRTKRRWGKWSKCNHVICLAASKWAETRHINNHDQHLLFLSSYQRNQSHSHCSAFAVCVYVCAVCVHS